jgi:hypothetical protein
MHALELTELTDLAEALERLHPGSGGGGGGIPEGKIQYLIRGVTISPVSSAQVRVDSPS